MTRQQLEEHRQLQARLNAARSVYHQLELKALPGAQRLDGMPRSGGSTDKVGELGMELARQWLDVEKLEREAKLSSIPIQTYIDTLDEPVTRMVIGLRVLCALSWKEVAIYCGRDQSVESVRKRFHAAVAGLP